MLSLWCDFNLLGDSPHESGHFAGDGDDNLVYVLAPGQELAVALTESDLEGDVATFLTLYLPLQNLLPVSCLLPSALPYPIRALRPDANRLRNHRNHALTLDFSGCCSRYLWRSGSRGTQ